jgi:hypothetical protein
VIADECMRMEDGDGSKGDDVREWLWKHTHRWMGACKRGVCEE